MKVLYLEYISILDYRRKLSENVQFKLWKLLSRLNFNEKFRNLFSLIITQDLVFIAVKIHDLKENVVPANIINEIADYKNVKAKLEWGAI